LNRLQRVSNPILTKLLPTHLTENIYYVEPNIFIPPKYQPIDKRTLDYLGLYDVILPSTSTNIEEAIV
jgi:hypothetical protein